MLLCGTDFSPGALPALRAAAALARKQAAALLLVHVLDHDDPGSRARAAARLSSDAAELRRTCDATIETLVLFGEPAATLFELIRERGVRLVVLGVTGSDPRSRPLGRVAEYLCQRVEVPVLLVRDADNLVSWSNGKLLLRALVGSGLGDASRSALAAIGNWPDVAVTIGHVAWPYGEHYRLGVKAPVHRDRLVPEVHDQLLGDLGRWALETPCRSTPKLRVVAGYSRVDFHLKELIDQTEADLLVVGIHQRNLSDDVWQSSISRSALQEATCNVLSVPERFLPVRTSPVPRVVVVPTDFSAESDRAIGIAASLLGLGGSLHILHVTNDPCERARTQALQQLKARIPKDAPVRRITPELRVLQGEQPWIEIWRHAERCRADFICMSARSRRTGPGLLRGSQTKAVMEHSQIPVVTVPPDRES